MESLALSRECDEIYCVTANKFTLANIIFIQLRAIASMPYCCLHEFEKMKKNA